MVSKVHKENILIIIPVINEAENLKILIPELVNLDLNLHILVIDDGSEDDTSSYIFSLQEAQTLPVYYERRNSRLGIGRAHLDALRFAELNGYTIALTMDGDLTHKTEDIPRMLVELNSNQESSVIIASRFKKDSEIQNWKLNRKIMTYLGHLLTRIILGLAEDVSSGFRIYNLEKIELDLFSNFSMDGYDFFFKSAFIFKHNEIKISEIGVSLRPRHYGSSKMYLSNIVSGLIELLRFRNEFRRRAGH
jgi:dolichol-phosphate mannosyltransferase